jgi:hypothetical protein
MKTTATFTVDLDPENVPRLTEAVTYWDTREVNTSEDLRTYGYHTDDLTDFARDVLKQLQSYRRT